LFGRAGLLVCFSKPASQVYLFMKRLNTWPQQFVSVRLQRARHGPGPTCFDWLCFGSTVKDVPQQTHEEAGSSTSISGGYIRDPFRLGGMGPSHALPD
jgi:hypothetical protein